MAEPHPKAQWAAHCAMQYESAKKEKFPLDRSSSPHHFHSSNHGKTVFQKFREFGQLQVQLNCISVS